MIMNSPEISPETHVHCKHIRSKEMYYQNLGQDNDPFASGIFWCTKTHEGFGPDGQPVGKKECCANRPCFS